MAKNKLLIVLNRFKIKNMNNFQIIDWVEHILFFSLYALFLTSFGS